MASRSIARDFLFQRIVFKNRFLKFELWGKKKKINLTTYTNLCVFLIKFGTLFPEQVFAVCM